MTHRSGLIVVFALISLASASSVAAQTTGTVRGTVTDSATGAPIVGAKVAVICSGCFGRHPTDSLGRYTIERVPVGTYTVEFNCPSRTMLGRALPQQRVTVGEDSVSDIAVTVAPGSCYEPPYSELTGVFRGYWTPGFESSKFVQCTDSVMGVATTLLPGKRLFSSSAWAALDARAQSQQIHWPSHAPIDEWGNHRYFVIWRGTLKGPGMYGHMGVSEFEMTVDSILAVRAPGPRDCSERRE